jgi:hypothetical protein
MADEPLSLSRSERVILMALLLDRLARFIEDPQLGEDPRRRKEYDLMISIANKLGLDL